MNTNEETMNIQVALDLLDISLNDIKVSELTEQYVKKQFHKVALKNHPDKNKSENATNKFQKINEAYEYLIKNACINESEDNSNANNTFVSSFNLKESNNYTNLLTSFISSITIGNYKDSIMHIVKAIVLNYDKISVKLFEELDKYTAVELYSIIQKYKNELHITDETLLLVSSIIKEKYKNDKLFVLNPTINDLLENKIYKLYVNNELYLVPLWHHELYFDCKDGSEIIVLCQPKIYDDNEMFIDELNNIHYNIIFDLRDQMMEYGYNLWNKKPEITIKINNKTLKIPIEKLYIKKEQKYIFKNEGISKINVNDIYDISCRSDIICHIKLESWD